MKLTKKEAARLMKEAGGSLDLSGTQIAALPDNLTVGGSLDLRGTQIAALPDNLTVGGSLDLRWTQIAAKERAKVRRLINGQISHGFYIYADDQLFLYSGKSHKRGKYTVYIGKIPGQYLVTDGEMWAHCKSFRAGVEDIVFKRASARGADQYKGADLDEPRTVEELKTMYRIITGACRAGTDAFVDSVRDLKDTYTIREVIAQTKGQYNSSVFQKFFEEGVDSDTST